MKWLSVRQPARKINIKQCICIVPCILYILYISVKVRVRVDFVLYFAELTAGPISMLLYLLYCAI